MLETTEEGWKRPLTLTLIRLKVFGKPIHHLIDGLVESILFKDASFVASPFGVVVPCEPCHGMETIPLKDIPTVQGTVIIHQQDIAWFHGQGCNVFFTGTFDFITIF